MVTQRLSGTWDLETLVSQELESQKTGVQLIEETGCHGPREPRRPFQVDACVPRNVDACVPRNVDACVPRKVQKLGKWVSWHPAILGSGHTEIYWPRKQGTVKPRDPEGLGSRYQGRKGPRGLGVEKPWHQQSRGSGDVGTEGST